MQERDDQILRHIGLYRISVRGVIENLFFNGESCDHVLQRLQEQRRIKAIKGLPENLSYYQLTLSELRRRGLPKHRADPRGERLAEDLAVLWFACMGERPRPRLERKPLENVFGGGPGMGLPHCRDKDAPEHQVIYRVRAPGAGTDDGRLLRDLNWWIRSALSHPKLSQYVLSKLYGFALLVDNPDRAARIESLIKKREMPEALILIEEVPGPDRLAEAIRKLRKGATS